jgi:class 3 adenylate cyclase/tetratricopeptide (TPR) repeat protein
VPDAITEERKVVTALFCDLVGFTATSEHADPEDVDAMLGTYFAMARGQIEAHGGVVEKFIGDAVLGVFGVPKAHEDDPERAIRAALRITEAAADLRSLGDAPLRLRVGVNTGEVLVRTGVDPSSGERFLAGDAINTASRIQSVAPEMGVAVGLATYRATRAVFSYEELPPATVKGKAEPVRVFHPSAPLARLGVDITRTHTTPFVGRAIDLSLLTGLFDKAVAANAPQLVTVTGEPGLGKSRIVAELLRHVDERPDLVTWRQGRCLPYGEGITFWALGEILKAHAGILESDDPTTATAKLEATLPDGEERGWFRARLLPLLGIEATSAGEREELFTAWRRFIEHIAEGGPTVLVFEDLHWADPALLAFLEHVANRGSGVPLLVVGTARPELFERHPDFGRGLRNHSQIRLDPLSPADTEQLVSALLETADIPTDLRGPILDRSGGNPLYAEEFVRLLVDRDLVVPTDRGLALRPGAVVPVPDSVAALIAARLDTLAPDRKAMLADAAVIGKVFWAGAVAAMGGRDEADVVEALHEMARRELVRPARRSSMDGEAEYAFWHVLARDVAYAQLPRAARAARHRAAAAWIESKAPERLADLADVLAHHYTSALDLATVTGQGSLVTELAESARRFLTLAGERALGLDTAAAVTAFERALALTPPGHPERPAALDRFGEVAFRAGRFAEAADALEEAIEGFRAQGDLRKVAVAMGTLDSVTEAIIERRRPGLTRDALAILEALPPGPDLVYALGHFGFTAVVEGRLQEGLELIDRAIGIADDAGLSVDQVLGFRALARATLGDPRGIDDFREAIARAAASGNGRREAVLHNNFGIHIRSFEGPRAALEVFQKGVALATSRGLEGPAVAIRTSALSSLLGTGELERLLGEAEDLGGLAEASHDDADLVEIRSVAAIARTWRGEPAAAEPVFDWMVATARQTGRADMIAGTFAAAMGVLAAADDRAGTAKLLSELDSIPGLGETSEFGFYLPMIVRSAIEIGQVELADRLARRLLTRQRGAEVTRPAVDAAIAEARNDPAAAAELYADAAAGWADFGAIPEQGFALLGRGRCLSRLARNDEAEAALGAARAIFAGSGMAPALAETDRLLVQFTSSRPTRSAGGPASRSSSTPGA